MDEEQNDIIEPTAPLSPEQTPAQEQSAAQQAEQPSEEQSDGRSYFQRRIFDEIGLTPKQNRIKLRYETGADFRDGSGTFDIFSEDEATKKRVSVHDPSVVWEPTSKRYYIFGSHRGTAYTTNMKDWVSASFTWKAGSNTNAGNDKAFLTPVVKKVKKGDVELDMPAFNAMDWAARTPTISPG